jgi:hypothetical protein
LDKVAISKPAERNLGIEPHPASRPEDISEARIRGIVSSLLDNVRRARDGEKHFTLRDQGLALGGYLHHIGWTQDEAVEQIIDALPSADDWGKARQTARWAITRGMQRPLDIDERLNPHNGTSYHNCNGRPSDSDADDADHEPWPSDSDDIQMIPADRIPISQIPPRQWAYGRFLLFGSAAVIGAADGTGKGYIAVTIMLAMITGLDLLGEKVWRTGDVAIVTYEDGKLEWERRFAAGCLHHQLDYADVMRHVRFVTKPTGRIVFAARGPRGFVFPDSEAIAKLLRAGNFVLLLIDPFNNAHTIDEGNNNVAIAAVAAELSRIADTARVAVLVLHHLKKGAVGDPDDLMGAVMLRANFRSCRILQKMTAEEADQLGLPANDAWRYVRISGTKENYAIPPEHATWFRLNSVNLGNATRDYPDGDAMAAVMPWTPPPMFAGMTAFQRDAVFDAISATPHAKDKRAKDIPWVGRPLIDLGDRTEGQASKIVTTWIRESVLVPGPPHKRANRTDMATLTTNPAKVEQIAADTPQPGFTP